MTLPPGSGCGASIGSLARVPAQCLAGGQGPSNTGHHPCWPLAPWGPLGTRLSPSHSGGPCPLPPRGLPQREACGAGWWEQLWGFPAPSLGVPRPCFLAVPTRPLPEQQACPSPCATPGAGSFWAGSWRLLPRPLESGAGGPHTGKGPETKRE